MSHDCGGISRVVSWNRLIRTLIQVTCDLNESCRVSCASDEQNKLFFEMIQINHVIDESN